MPDRELGIIPPLLDEPYRETAPAKSAIKANETRLIVGQFELRRHALHIEHTVHIHLLDSPGWGADPFQAIKP